MFESAKWITRTVRNSPWSIPKPGSNPPSPFLVKDFELKNSVKNAVLNIVGLGQGAYYINGERIKDSYLPTYRSCYYKTVFYNVYNVTDMLKIGRNRIGVVLGNTGYSDVPGFRFYSVNNKVIAQLDIEYSDGTHDTVVSDTSWKTHDSPTLMSRRRCGDRYDARLEIPDWSHTKTNISDWDNALICRGAGGEFKPIMCPPKRLKKVTKGIEIAPNVFDFGMNTAGWVRIKVCGKRGSELKLRYAELLSEDKKSVDQTIINNGGNHSDIYILKGEPWEEWEQLFEYHGFRYVQIDGEYDSIEVYALTVHTDLTPVSYFECDNKTINNIHSAIGNSILTCCQGVFVDCPHREQNEWTGDALLGAEAICIDFDAYDTFMNWMYSFKDEQRGDGQLPCIVPDGWGQWTSNFANGIDWDSAIIHIPYYCMKYTELREIVDLVWENMLKSMQFFASMSETHLQNHGLGDWAGFVPCNKEITDTAFYRINALMLAEMADFTGRQSAEFLKLSEEIKQEFRKKYVKNGRLCSDHETAIAMSIYAGFLEPQECKAEAARLAEIIKSNGYCFMGGTHEIKTIFDVLTDYGYVQVLFDTMVNDKKPGFAQNLLDGCNTIWEFPDGSHSHNHYFKCQPDAWLYKSLAGIKLKGFGFGNVVIEPHFVNGISRLSAEMHGIKTKYDEKHLWVSSPYSFTLKLNGETKKYSAGEYEFSL